MRKLTLPAPPSMPVRRWSSATTPMSCTERTGNGTLIVYSIGNFVFDYFSGRMNDTAIMDVTLGPAGVESVNWIPIVIERGFPRPAVGAEVPRIMRQLPLLATL